MNIRATVGMCQPVDVQCEVLPACAREWIRPRKRERVRPSPSPDPTDGGHDWQWGVASKYQHCGTWQRQILDPSVALLVGLESYEASYTGGLTEQRARSQGTANPRA